MTQLPRQFHLLTMSALLCALAACDSKPNEEASVNEEASEIKPDAKSHTSTANDLDSQIRKFATGIVALPKTTIKTTVLVGGEVVEKKEDDFVGVFAWKLDDLTTLTGEYLGSSTFTIREREHTAFRYSYELRTRNNAMKGELWVSEGIPGGVYRHTAEATGAQEGVFTMPVTALESEELREDLQRLENGGFAFAPPEGWHQTDARDGEVLRLVPVARDKELNRAVTVERMTADGKDYEQWGAVLSEDDSKYGLSGNYMGGLGDSPTFDIRYWSGSESRVWTAMTGTVRNDHLYLISHWQDRVAPRGAAGRDVIAGLAESWRWLQEQRCLI